MTPAVGLEQARIQRLARDMQLVDVVGEHVAQEVARAGALEVDDAHVRDVEHAGVAAHRVVLVDLRAVVHRHVPAAEVDHARAGGAMDGMKGVCFCTRISRRKKQKGEAVVRFAPSVLLPERLRRATRRVPLRWAVAHAARPLSRCVLRPRSPFA